MKRKTKSRWKHGILTKYEPLIKEAIFPESLITTSVAMGMLRYFWEETEFDGVGIA